MPRVWQCNNDREIVMTKKRRWLTSAVIAAVLLLALIVANVNECGQAMSGHYDWTCEQCGVRLYNCPPKNNITSLEAPATYQAHQHAWKLVHRPPNWSPWKPWHWLVYLDGDPTLLKEPDPATIFQLAGPDMRYSDRQGLRVLASDPHYARAQEIAAWITEAASQAAAEPLP